MTIVKNQPELSQMRRALGSFAASVNVITTRTETGTPTGMTATAFSAVSYDPPSVLIAVNRDSRTNEHIAANGRFGVNILSDDDVFKSNYFATPGQDKAVKSEWIETEWDWNSPCLTSAMTFFDCVISQQVDAGTHTVFIGDVVQLGISESRRQVNHPLIHYRGKYRRLREQTQGITQMPLPIVINDTFLSEVYF